MRSTSRKTLVVFTFLIFSFASISFASSAFTENFDQPPSISARWKGGTFMVVDHNEAFAIQMDNADSTKNNDIVSTLDPNAISGKRVVISAAIQAQNVSKKPASYYGIKVMISYKTRAGVSSNPQIDINLCPTDGSVCTFDWTHFYKVIVVPEDVVSASVTLGLEKVSGSVQFDDIRIDANSILFSDNFNIPETSMSRWRGGSMAYEGDAIKGYSIRMTNSISDGQNTTYTSILASSVANRRVALRAKVKADHVSTKPQSYYGIKIMLSYTSKGQTFNPQIPLDVGTFDWKSVNRMIAIPADATNISLTLGLQKVTGTVWFDDIHLDVVDEVDSTWTNPTPYFTGHVESDHYRGMNVGTKISSTDIDDLKSWNANVVRWQLGSLTYPNGLSTPNYYVASNPSISIIDQELAKLDNALPNFASKGMHVVVDLHSLSGNQFVSSANQALLISTWKRIAQKYSNNSTIWGYDIANEPDEPNPWSETLLNWNELSEQVAFAIRDVDSDKPIIIEPTLKGSVGGLNYLRPVRSKNIIYSFHYYDPMDFTHQGVTGYENLPAVTYPGTINNVNWNKTTMTNAMKPAFDFQDQYKVGFYVGEFSASSKAQGAAEFLSDCIDIFESRGWDWTYFVFRAYIGWDVEQGADHPVGSSVTYREQVLQSWFSENLQPAIQAQVDVQDGNPWIGPIIQP